jgi:hypothetical protein
MDAKMTGAAVTQAANDYADELIEKYAAAAADPGGVRTLLGAAYMTGFMAGADTLSDLVEATLAEL